MREAIHHLRAVLQPLRVGPLFRTRPLGDLPQPPYLNTAVVGQPLLPADELLAVAKALELATGRRPGPRHA
ncbi:MAG: 2-amino-4-hydroxy-6-hydroxymethyldihydropteridine diphosphokinase, partial [bacterium]|nr:2-amino-4-hydroxy-6-hydroxymethyldihydropteridine diphosphokinase [bacterium]